MTFRVLGLHQRLVSLFPHLNSENLFSLQCLGELKLPPDTWQRSGVYICSIGSRSALSLCSLDRDSRSIHTKIEHHWQLGFWCTDRYPKPYLRSVLASSIPVGPRLCRSPPWL